MLERWCWKKMALHLVERMPDEVPIPSEPIHWEDPSEYRPEKKDVKDFRDYDIHSTPERVIKTYYDMHTNQTLDFVKKRMEFWGKFDHAEMTILEALEALNSFVDDSDPDLDLPNAFHAFQTAEGIRKAHPDKEWFQVVGLIHDLGKVMGLWGEPQWATVGDTFPVGCEPADCIVFGKESFKNNPDIKNEKLNTRLGIYEEICGLDKVYMSWGHDEYLYRVLLANKHNIPEEGMYMIRFHSFYPWHTGGAYSYLCNNKDMEMIKWIRLFNQFDLYTKSPDLPDVEELLPYYQNLVDKYVPGKLKW